VIREDSLRFAQEQRVWAGGLSMEVSGWSTAVKVDRDTRATGVDDSARVCSMGDRLGGVKANPLVYELGSVPGRKKFHSQHGGATLRTTEAWWEMGRVGSGSRWPRMVQQ